MTLKRLLILNPNSSNQVSHRIIEAIGSLGAGTKIRIEHAKLENAPIGIETAEHVRLVTPMIKDAIQQGDHDAFVLACFSDPGIRQTRAATGKRVFGIGECAYLEAMSVAEKFGIIAIGDASCERQLAYLDDLGFRQRLAATVPLNLSVGELEDESRTRQRLDHVATELLDHGARCLILGCAGMSHYLRYIQHKFAIPVVDPTVSATWFALKYLESATT